MVHNAGIRGYIFTYLFGLIAVLVLTSRLFGFLEATNLVTHPYIFIGIRIALLYLVSLGVANQFMSIEERPPTPGERDLVTTLCFLFGSFIVGFGLLITFNTFMETQSAEDYKVLRTALDSAVTLAVTIYLSLYLNLGVFARKRFERHNKDRF